MKVARGEVVLVRWPFSDWTGRKVRPAVVVQADFLNVRITDTVLIQISGQTRGTVTEVPVDPAIEPRSGLRRLSYAVCNNVLTFDQAFILRKLGELSPTVMRQIEDRLKTALDLP